MAKTPAGNQNVSGMIYILGRQVQTGIMSLPPLAHLTSMDK